MATFNIELFKKKSGDKNGYVVIVVRSLKEKKLISLEMEKIDESQWDGKRGRVINHIHDEKMNKLIKSRRRTMEDLLDEMPYQTNWSAEEIKQRYYARIGKVKKFVNRKKEAKQDMMLLYRIEQFAGTHKTQRTQDIYMTTHRMLNLWDQAAVSKLTIDKIDKKWIDRFHGYMVDTRGNSNNAAAIHHRNIRAVLNDALDRDLIVKNPYASWKIKTDETRKRALSIAEVRSLQQAKVEPYQEKYRDMFMLMIYLIGINPVDLMKAKWSDVRDGRLEYKRAKTGTLYSICIPEEAMEIIERYKGKKYLLNISEEWKNYMDFTRRMNEGLKKIGASKRKGRGGKKTIVPMFPDLSCYWARFTWASLASKLDYSKEIIGHALGHKWSHTVTDIYIDFDMKKVDDAQRKVIDYILQKE